MNNQIKEIITKLTKQHKTISVMESCTGGGVANALTNIEGSSEVLKFSAITYSNEYKIKMGVNQEIISRYTVYSIETADDMSKAISLYTNSNYGVGITGKLNRIDRFNPYGEDNLVYISVYDKDHQKYHHNIIKITESNRIKNKNKVIENVINMLNDIINN